MFCYFCKTRKGLANTLIGGACDPNISLATPIVLSATKPLRLHKPVAAAPLAHSFSVFLGPSVSARFINTQYKPVAKPLLRAPHFQGGTPWSIFFNLSVRMGYSKRPTNSAFCVLSTSLSLYSVCSLSLLLLPHPSSSAVLFISQRGTRRPSCQVVRVLLWRRRRDRTEAFNGA